MPGAEEGLAGDEAAPALAHGAQQHAAGAQRGAAHAGKAEEEEVVREGADGGARGVWMDALQCTRSRNEEGNKKVGVG